MKDIISNIESLAKRIHAPKEIMPTYDKSEDSARPHIEFRGNEFHWVVVERGQELERRQTTNQKELLFWVLDAITFEMASRMELERRIGDEDCRIQLFKIQEDLIKKIDKEYYEPLYIKHQNILKQ